MWSLCPSNRHVLLVALLGLCLPPADLSAQVEAEPSHRFVLEEVLSIGDDEDAPIEYLFSGIDHVRTDADGRIYVVEGGGIGSPPGQRVRVFSSDGEFLGALGRSGGGPGEFRAIEAIALDSEEQLVVYDAEQDRFTRFPPFETIESFPRPDPERLETVPNPQDFRFSPGFMHGLPNGRLVLFYQPSRGERSPDQPRLHVYDERLDKVGAFGTPNEWNLPNEKVTQHFVRTPLLFGGSHVASGTSSLVLAPTLYQGLLYRYVPAGDGTWTLQRLEGRDPGHPTHEPVESPDNSFSFFTSAGIGARYRSASHGVGQLSDGRVVHLSTSEDEEGVRQLQLELFGSEGTLQKVGRIDGFVHDKSGFDAVKDAVNVSLLWVDRNDRLYLVDSRDVAPVLRIMELEK